MECMKGKEWNRSGKNLAERINQEHRLIYYFLPFRGMSTQIQIQKEWADYIKQNYEIIEGWIELNLIQPTNLIQSILAPTTTLLI